MTDFATVWANAVQQLTHMKIQRIDGGVTRAGHYYKMAGEEMEAIYAEADALYPDPDDTDFWQITVEEKMFGYLRRMCCACGGSTNGGAE